MSDRPCTICGTRPRHVSSGGKEYTHCTECRRENQRRWAATYIAKHVEASPLCNDCHEQPKVRLSSGKYLARCRECNRTYRREHYRIQSVGVAAVAATPPSQPLKQPQLDESEEYAPPTDDVAQGLMARSLFWLDHARAVVEASDVDNFGIHFDVGNVTLTFGAKKANRNTNA